MSTSEALGPQFVNSLHDVPMTPSHKLGTAQQQVRHVPVESFQHVWSGEYGTRVHEMEQARHARLQGEEGYPRQHPRDNPGAQEALEADVAEHGVKKPVIVGSYEVHSESAPRFGLEDGSHRVLAAMRTGQTHVPTVVRW